MLSRSVNTGAGAAGVLGGSVVRVSQVRYRRTLAYPFYSKAGNIPPARRNRKQTVFKRLMDQFLGPKNFKGEYYANKYTYLSTQHKTNYIDPSSERGVALLSVRKQSKAEVAEKEEDDDDEDGEEYGEEAAEGASRERDPLRPFPDNEHCLSNTQVSNEMKQAIVDDVLVNEMSSQNVALKYGLKIQRIEAILKLNEVEKKWEDAGLITNDIKRMSSAMYGMLPLFSRKNVENLTEIPIPEETKQSRFMTIAESEPFGPVDAAREFGIEPAAETLRKLSEGGAHSSHAGTIVRKKDNSFIAPMHEGDRTAVRFTDVKVGQVGYRYGRPLRDNRKDRKIGFDASGKMVYLLE